MIRKLVVLAFYLLNNTFDTIPTPLGFVVESKAQLIEFVLEPPGIVDEERGVLGVVTLPKITEEPSGRPLIPSGKEPDLGEFVRFRINHGNQP